MRRMRLERKAEPGRALLRAKGWWEPWQKGKQWTSVIRLMVQGFPAWVEVWRTHWRLRRQRGGCCSNSSGKESYRTRTQPSPRDGEERLLGELLRG